MNDAEKLREEGYGWKRVRVRCSNTLSCGWEGRRVWRKEMFDKPCPRCGSIDKSGRTSVFCPPTVVKEKNKKLPRKSPDTKITPR